MNFDTAVSGLRHVVANINQGISLTKVIQFDIVGTHTLRNQYLLDAKRTTIGELHVVDVRTYTVRMATDTDVPGMPRADVSNDLGYDLL
jgi:hypothetical protein